MSFQKMRIVILVVLSLAIILSTEFYLQRELKILQAGDFYDQIIRVSNKENQTDIFYQLILKNLAGKEKINEWDPADIISLEEKLVYDEVIISLYLERRGVKKLIWCIEKRRIKPGTVKVLAEEAAILLAHYLSQKNQPEVDKKNG